MKYEKWANCCFFVKMFPLPLRGASGYWSMNRHSGRNVSCRRGLLWKKDKSKHFLLESIFSFLPMSVSVCFLKQGEHLHACMRICLASPRLCMGRRSLCLEGRDNNTWNTPPGLKWEDLRQACLVGTQSKNYIRKLVTLSREVGGID